MLHSTMKHVFTTWHILDSGMLIHTFHMHVHIYVLVFSLAEPPVIDVQLSNIIFHTKSLVEV